MDDSGGPSILVSVIGTIISLLLAVMFTLTEYSVVRTRSSELEDLKKKRGKSSKNINLATHMLDNISEYLSTAQTGVTTTSLIIGWLGEDLAQELLEDSGVFSFLGHKADLSISSIMGILIFTFVHAVFTDLVPKNIAISEPVKVLLRIAQPVRFFHLILWPLIWLFDKTAAGITKTLGFKMANEEDIYSPSELISLTQTSALASNSSVNKEDAAFTRRAFEMNDKVASDIMIDRTSMITIDVSDTIDDAINLYLTDMHSRFPVTANNDKDKILGYVYNLDLIRQARINKREKISKVMRSIFSIPENMKVPEVMRRMSQHRVPMAVVIDEYGGTSGIITDKDIYEELFGNIKEEKNDESDEMIKKNGENSYKVSGKTSVYDLEDYFNTKFPDFDKDEAVTLAGYFQNNYPELRKNDSASIKNDKYKLLIKAGDYRDSYIDFFIVKIFNKRQTLKNKKASEKTT